MPAPTPQEQSCREAPQVLKSRLLAIVLLQGYAPRLGCRHWAAAAETVGTAAAAAVAATEVAAEVESGGSSPKNLIICFRQTNFGLPYSRKRRDGPNPSPPRKLYDRSGPEGPVGPF